MSNDPYESFKDDTIPSNLMTVLSQLADEQTALEKLKIKIEAELEEVNQALRQLSDIKIPAAAEGLQGKLKLDDGRTIEIGEKIRASISGEKKFPAIAWLDKNDFGHIVKRQVILEFARDDHENFNKVKKALEATGVPANMKIESNVHWMTLEAWVREKLKEGVNLPRDIFGIYIQKISKITEADR